MADQLQPIPLVTPGFQGLNKAQASVPDLDPSFAIECQNFIFDQSGRLASRQGWLSLTTTPLAGTPAVQSVGELALANGNTFLVSAANNKLYSGTTVLTDITGTLTITANNWQWMTFNGAIYGVQTGHPLIMWNGTGNFTTITASSGTVPSGGSCGVACFGRLWIVGPDNQTIYYCNLLDSTAWSGAGAGSINLATVWTRGIDQIIGIAAAGSKLVVFGTKQIIIYYDTTSGGVIGLNPTNIAVYDTIEGTGLAARDTIQSTGEGDLTFLSPTGVQSLARLLSSGKDNPVNSLDTHIHDYFNGYFLSENPYAVRSTYSPINRFYLILLPIAQRVFAYDTRQPMQSGALRVTEWPAQTYSSMVTRKSGAVVFGQNGLVGQYGGYTDNLVPFGIVYNSPVLALKPNFENKFKILKLLKAVLFYGGNTVCTFSWGTDFAGLVNTKQISLMGVISEYGIAQYGINEFGGGAGISIQSFPLSNSGRWLQFGLTAQINGYQLAIQQLDAFCKIGKTV